jgi:hypothetical protein
MKVLIACEFSGVVREAFRSRGHDAFSCDILPSRIPSNYHLQKDVREVLDYGWDLMIAHPPCTWLCSSGLHWNKRGRNGLSPAQCEEQTNQSLEFVAMLMNSNIPMWCVENPIGCISTRIQKSEERLFGIDYTRYDVLPLGSKVKKSQRIPMQIIQPYEFGHDASKATCLFLNNLPPLVETSYYPPRIAKGKQRWGNQTDSGQNKLGPSEDRWAERSITYQGVADAMAEQWGELNVTNVNSVGSLQE